MQKVSELTDRDNFRMLYILAFISILGNILDIVSGIFSDFIIRINIITICIIVFFVILTKFSQLKVKYSYAIIIYSLIINVFLSQYSILSQIDDLYMLRSLFLIIAFIPSSAFLINRNHALYIGFLSLIFTLFVTYYTKSLFFFENIYFLSLLLLGLSIGMYYLMYLLEESLKNESLLHKELKSINTQSVFLNNLSFKLIDYFDQNETIPFILKSIKNYTECQFATFSIYDDQQKALVLKSVEVESVLLKAAVRIGGNKLLNTASPLSDENYAQIMNEIVSLKQSFTDITFGAISPKIDASLRKISKTTRFYGIAHIISGKLYGTTVLAFNTTQFLPSLELLKSYAHITALVLRRNLTEKALEDSENKLRRLTDNISDVVFVANLDFTINYITPSIAKLTGFTAEEYIQKSLSERYPESSQKIIKDLFKEEMLNELNISLDSNRSRIIELDLFKKDGSILHTSIHTSFIRNKLGDPVGIQGVVRDITTIKETANQLQKYSSELKQLNHDKDRFIQILAHDLKNPFNSILGLSEILKSNLEEFDQNQLRFMAESIHSSANCTYNLLEELLTWSRANSGKLPFNPTFFDSKAECLDIINNINDLAQKKFLQIDCSHSSTSLLFADKTMWRTILRNLLTNAIKFSFPYQKIQLTSTESDNEFIFTVSDSGTGISEDIQKRIWDISFHHYSRGTFDEVGTGLGLIICKELVEIHKGSISLKSALNKGSTFYFSIPKNIETAD